MTLSCLFIEDNIDNHFLFEFYIKGLMDLTCVDNTDEAIKLIEQQRYDLFLIDLNLPGHLSSWQVIDKIQEICNPSPQIWIISAMQQYEIQSKLDKYPNVTFIAKPIRKYEFIAKIKSTFSI